MAEQQEQDRTEHATQHKIREAQKRGFVSKSIELNSFVMLSGFLGILYFWGERLVKGQARIDRAILEVAGRLDFTFDTIWAWMLDVGAATVALVAVPMIGLIVCALLVNFLQTGPVLTFFPMKPDLDRINPVSGLRRLFSLRILLEAAKSFLKVMLFASLLHFTLLEFMPMLLGLAQQDPHSYPETGLALAVKLVARMLVVLLVIAIIDWAFNRWDYQNKLRMSRRELKEEIKQREGDPRIRARIRELQREQLKRSKSLARIKDADVLITNPTHLAVALQYKRHEMEAPRVIAKGAGELAATMKQLARRHHIPIVQNKLLATELYKAVNSDKQIPLLLYSDVARVLVWVFARRGNEDRGPVRA